MAAYPPGAQRPPGPPGGPQSPGQSYVQSLSRGPTFDTPLVTEEIPPPPPPENTWPCGCAYPGTHKTDCMWSLWEQMRDNYLQTKKLMNQFMSQVDSLQSPDRQRGACACPPGCHGRDLGEAMGLQEMQGVTVPWLQPPGMGCIPGLTTLQKSSPPVGDYASESRQLMEEQRRIKNTWAQFLNIFDMALDLANDVSKDRCEAARKRKERERLERRERREEEKRERQECRDKCAEERRGSRTSETEGREKAKEKKIEQKKKDTKKASQEPKSTSQDKPQEEEEPGIELLEQAEEAAPGENEAAPISF